MCTKGSGEKAWLSISHKGSMVPSAEGPAPWCLTFTILLTPCIFSLRISVVSQTEILMWIFFLKMKVPSLQSGVEVSLWQINSMGSPPVGLCVSVYVFQVHVHLGMCIRSPFLQLGIFVRFLPYLDTESALFVITGIYFHSPCFLCSVPFPVITKLDKFILIITCWWDYNADFVLDVFTLCNSSVSALVL